MGHDLGALAIAKHKGKIIFTNADKILLSGRGSQGYILSIPLVMYQH